MHTQNSLIARYLFAAFAIIAMASLGPSTVLAQSQKADTVIVTGKISLVANSNCVARGALVYIPGRSFVAKLDNDGQFALYQVPQAKGNYTLRIEIPNMQEGAFDVTLNAKPPMVNMGTITVPGSCTTGGGGGGGGSCPTVCDDNNRCTTDTCNGSTSTCVFTPTITYINAACDPATGGMGACNAGFADCVNGSADGCETNTAVDVNNCGGCGVSCLAAGFHVCVGGVCANPP
jgi:Dictyostelium (slime mold) repeat